jgi:hypothetical protein
MHTGRKASNIQLASRAGFSTGLVSLLIAQAAGYPPEKVSLD